MYCQNKLGKCSCDATCEDTYHALQHTLCLQVGAKKPQFCLSMAWKTAIFLVPLRAMSLCVSSN